MTAMLDRWQFGVTIVYHFLFVPVTIGLGLLVAILETLAYRRKDETWLRLARFFGRLFLINFAMGVVTGIVQEFQFGMNWSAYSIFVGNIFGAPLAIEGLLAFFMESTFLGLWIFGRDRLPPRVHLATIWLASLGTVLSALFILAANAWMQHPVGYRVVHHKALLTNFWALLGNVTLWEEFAHTFLGAIVTGAMLMLGVSAWRLLTGRDAAPFTRTLKLGAWVGLVGVLAVMFTGDLQGRLMDEEQPMKMAAAEALYHTSTGASFSLLTVGNLAEQPIFQVRVPHLLSLIEELSWNGKVKGIDEVQAADVRKYGKGSYIPVIWLSYWSFRLMIGFGVLILVITGWALILARLRRLEGNRWFLWGAVVAVAFPLLANTFGWILTESGRQPWVVYGLMKTSAAISPGLSTATVAVTLGGFVVLYTVLAVIDGALMLRSARRDLEDVGEGHEPLGPGETALVY